MIRVPSASREVPLHGFSRSVDPCEFRPSAWDVLSCLQRWVGSPFGDLPDRVECVLLSTLFLRTITSVRGFGDFSRLVVSSLSYQVQVCRFLSFRPGLRGVGLGSLLLCSSV